MIFFWYITCTSWPALVYTSVVSALIRNIMWLCFPALIYTPEPGSFLNHNFKNNFLDLHAPTYSASEHSFGSFDLPIKQTMHLYSRTIPVMSWPVRSYIAFVFKWKLSYFWMIAANDNPVIQSWCYMASMINNTSWLWYQMHTVRCASRYIYHN